MMNHLSTIGFDVRNSEEFFSLAREVKQQSQVFSVNNGQYLKWAGNDGEQLWIQVDKDDNLIGMNPHFKGQSSVSIELDKRLQRHSDSLLDGCFHGWVGPVTGDLDQRLRPLLIDLPDAAFHSNLKLPGRVNAQIAAFTHDIKLYDALPEEKAKNKCHEVKFAYNSAVAANLFRRHSVSNEIPDAMASLSGTVVDAAYRQNQITGTSYYWMLVSTLGGSYDVVADQALLPTLPAAGCRLTGTFWLSAKLTALMH